MSPQHPTPGANAEAAAAPRVREAGSSPTPSAPSPEAPTPDAGPEAESATTPTGTDPTASAPTGTTAAPEAESRTPPTAKTAAAPPSASAAAKASKTTEAPEEGVGVAAAVGTAAPGVRTATGVHSGRPRKPVLAGAAIVGAVLIAVPLLLAGGANDEKHGDTAKGLTAQGSDTVLNPDSSPAAVDDYVAQKPSPSPSREKPKKSEAPKVVAPQPPAPKPVTSAPKAKASSPPAKKPKPKPKAAPEPDWSTETVFATSVLEVNQAWTTNRIRMVMQTDGNLVVYNEKGKPIWASMTFGQNHRAIFQTDGNLVIHNGDDRPIWASQTWGNEGAQLVLRADAKVAIVNNGRVLWST
ncbi:mannose-binding protein [Streptomyces sp. NPDC050287]|uniref:mannose-binding protein n=1 Tax=Streptomyces sp. NPDC050287 TaxID=3365608 RepID=UPI0037AE76D5